jgi:threonine synthase
MSEPMRYVSTRGTAPTLEFADVLLTGLASDGGLYVPVHWPTISLEDLRSWQGRPYDEVAAEVMWPFVDGSLDRDDFEQITAEAYAGFDDPAVVPVSTLSDGLHVAELFHGPTLAFKDLALQLVGRLFDHELAARGDRATIVVATSGDTGSAAIEALRGRGSVDVFVLHPAGRVSEVQRRQMTTVASDNVHNIAVDGTFDDCQDLVKGMFGDEEFRVRHRLSAVNSINWARVMAQLVYYVTSALAVGEPGGPVSFTVPTGNFGNIFAGYGALRMGLPINRLVVASNRNDILTRFLDTGEMEIREVHATVSPSMDIQVSSNLERLLFDLYGRDGTAIADLMQQFRADGVVSVDAERVAALGENFAACRLNEDETLEVIKATYESDGLLLDPHTAVGVGAARRVGRGDGPMVALATAHPAKFPDAVEQATGVRPALPPSLADLFDRPERYVSLPDDLGDICGHIDTALR